MNIKPRRTVEGLITATAERVTSVSQLKENDLVMVGFDVLHDFMPYRVVDIDGKLSISQVSAIIKCRFLRIAVSLPQDTDTSRLIIYKAEIDATDKTHPERYLALLLLVATIYVVLSL